MRRNIEQRAKDMNMNIYTKLWLVFFVWHCVDANLDAALKFFLVSGNTRSGAGSTGDAVKNLYDLYRREYKKNTKSSSDDTPRLASFNETLNAIVNQFRQGDRNFDLELNEYSDWTNDELNRLRGTHVPNEDNSFIDAKSDERPARWGGRIFMSKADSPSQPTSFDFTTRVVSGTNVSVVSILRNQTFEYHGGSCL